MFDVLGFALSDTLINENDLTHTNTEAPMRQPVYHRRHRVGTPTVTHSVPIIKLVHKKSWSFQERYLYLSQYWNFIPFLVSSAKVAVYYSTTDRHTTRCPINFQMRITQCINIVCLRTKRIPWCRFFLNFNLLTNRQILINVIEWKQHSLAIQ